MIFNSMMKGCLDLVEASRMKVLEGNLEILDVIDGFTLAKG